MGDCGSVGTMSRHRDCVPPTNGGYECPAPFDSEIAECETAPCPGKRKISAKLFSFMTYNKSKIHML